MTVHVLTVPGFHGSEAGHWQTWLETTLPNARRVTGIDWEQPRLHRWANAIVQQLDSRPEPTLIVAHSFGCLASALAIATRPERVAGVIMVAPADPERFSVLGLREGESSEKNQQEESIARYLPEQSLDVMGLLIASNNDPWMQISHAFAWSQRWQLAFHNAGAVGHINCQSGFGPWPLIKLFTESLCSIADEVRQPLGQLVGDYGRQQLGVARFLYA